MATEGLIHVRAVRVVAALLTLVLMSACGAPAGAPGSANLASSADPGITPQARWEQTLAAAKQEGKLVIVTHTNLYYRRTVEKFQERYPEIEVEHVAMRPSEFTPKVVTEQQNGIFGYDAWLSPTSNMVEVVVPAGGFEKLPPFLILPEVTDPANYRGGKPLYAISDPYVFVYMGNVTSNVWVNRTQLPASELSRFDQLLDPKYRGKIVIRTPDAPHAASLTMTGMLRNKGEDYINRLLKDQQPVFIDNARLLTQDLINGKYPIAIGIDGETMDGCQREGGCKNMEQLFDDAYLLAYGVGVMKNVPHPNAAAVFVNWFLSKEGQQAYVKAVIDTLPPPVDVAHSIRKDVEPHAGSVALGSVPDYDHLEKYSLQGMESGSAEMKVILAAFKKIQGGN